MITFYENLSNELIINDDESRLRELLTQLVETLFYIGRAEVRTPYTSFIHLKKSEFLATRLLCQKKNCGSLIKWENYF